MSDTYPGKFLWRDIMTFFSIGICQFQQSTLGSAQKTEAYGGVFREAAAVVSPDFGFVTGFPELRSEIAERLAVLATTIFRKTHGIWGGAKANFRLRPAHYADLGNSRSRGLRGTAAWSQRELDFVSQRRGYAHRNRGLVCLV